MTNIATIIKRFFEGTGHVVSTPSGDARGHVREKDFMTQDLTAGTRF
jgi:hypothetical protein